MCVNKNVTLLSLYSFEKRAKICENSQRGESQKIRKRLENKGFSSVLRRRGNNRNDASQAEKAGSIPVPCSKTEAACNASRFCFGIPDRELKCSGEVNSPSAKVLLRKTLVRRKSADFLVPVGRGSNRARAKHCLHPRLSAGIAKMRIALCPLFVL